MRTSILYRRTIDYPALNLFKYDKEIYLFRYFAEKKKKISLYLKKFLEERKNELRKVNDFGADICTRLYDYSVRGKMLRGGLVFLGYDLFLGSALEGEIVKIEKIELRIKKGKIPFIGIIPRSLGAGIPGIP